jgi:indolepyruvate ferredoxin oxidoreductase beta subunit
MQYNIIIAGTGGQGILSIASVIALSAMNDNLAVKQSEIHGMSQRGGSVSANVKISDHAISSGLIAKGNAQMILSMEPIEGLRYLDYLSATGMLITAKAPVKNIPDYPELDAVYTQIQSLPHQQLVDAKQLASKAKAPRGTNMVLVGVASKYLPIKRKCIKDAISMLFAKKGEQIIESNLRAFELGANNF